MDEKEKKAAAQHAARARRQAGHSAKNVARAAEDFTEGLREDVEENVDKAVETAKRFNPRVVGFITSETGQGFLAVSVSIAAALFAQRKFKSGWSARKAVISPSPE